MASAIIHLAVAKKLAKELFITDKYDYLLGAIAPDISKQIGKSKEDSHFLKNTVDDIPNIYLFIKKYPDFKYNSFDLGYFTHLYTDKLWFEEFMPSITINNSIKLLDGTIIQTKDQDEITRLIYSDYTNLNIRLIEEYNLDLSLFYEDFKIPKTKMTEIPVENLDILINKMGILIENSKETKSYSFDMLTVHEFIDKCVDEILEIIKKY
jgi:hypothetical protein